MKTLILSCAVNGREDYVAMSKGLEESVKNFDYDFQIYKEFPTWCWEHSMFPYAFKLNMIADAFGKGYRRIFWLDSSMRILKDVNELLDNSHGIVVFDNLGHPLNNYINDNAIRNLEIDSLENVKQIWGGAVGYDFTKDISNIIFYEAATQVLCHSFNSDNTTRDGFISHRHDQAVLSWLCHKHKIGLLPYGILAAKKDITNQTYIQYGD